MEKLVRQYHMPLRAYLVGKVGDHCVADDIAQEVFLAVFRKGPEFDSEGSLKSWLFAVARNKAVDYLRKCIRNRETSCGSLDHLLAEHRLNSADEKINLLLALKRCLTKLQPRAKSLVQLFYFEQKNSDQVATATGLKSSAVRMSLLRIRKSLASCIRSNIDGDFDE